MKGFSLVRYLFVAAINIFLIIPVLYNPLIIGLIHILICVVSYNWLFRQKTFKSNWNEWLFSALPTVGQIVFMLLFFVEDFSNWRGILSLFDNIIMFAVLLLSFVEFIILTTLYAKYLKRRK